MIHGTQQLWSKFTSVFPLPPPFSFPLSISQRGLDFCIGSNRQNCKQVNSRNHGRLPRCHPLLVPETQMPRCCCRLSQFSVITTVISHLCQELILCKPLGSLTHFEKVQMERNLSRALSCHFPFWHGYLILKYLFFFFLLWLLGWQSGPKLSRDKTEGHRSPLFGNLI